MKYMKIRKQKQKEYLKLQVKRKRMICKATDMLIDGLIKNRGLSGYIDYLTTEFKRLEKKTNQLRK